ncbi:MAG TPA: TRAP transporter substrate-binding protein DctP [Sandaracinaceae bacterium LLY-WYZ-13_1]|nr:TRAP transporter substrate-binding protein DctP [Sandaracinaceae bacterium LLY-WYZ-13_1]
MKRALLVLLLTLPLLVSCDEPTGRGREIWRFAIEETSGSVQDAYAQRFAELVEERTGGEVDVIVYPIGSLGTSDHITEQLHNGTLEFATASPGHLGKLIPEVQAFLLHFVLSEDSRVTAEALRDPELREFLDDLYAEKGLSYLTAFGEGWMVWTTQDEIRHPDDFDGQRFRVMTSPLLLASYEAYGASPTPLPYTEVYSGLQLHMIDGQVNPVFAIEEMSFYEVTEYMIFPQHAEFITTVASNPRFLAELSPERRRMVEEIVDQLQTEIYEIQDRYNQERLETIREARPEMHIVHLTEEQRDAFRERSMSVRGLYVEMAGPRGRALLEILDRAVARAEARVGEADDEAAPASP